MPVQREGGIAWTDRTWNPVRGCVKVSPGCKHCYAETFAERWRGIPGHPYEQGFDLRLVPEKLDEPLRWRKPARIFVNSMSDLFQEGVPFDFIDGAFVTMVQSPRHTYQILTKRPENMRAYFQNPHRHLVRLGSGLPEVPPWPLPNVWLGVSVEDRKYGLPRIDILRKVPAVVRFLSIEPLLEDLGTIDLTGIHWVIVGGESGPGARPMHPDWVRSIRDQCSAAGVPFFFKQWGEWTDLQHAGGNSWTFTRTTKSGARYGVVEDNSGDGSWRIGEFETRYPWHTTTDAGPCMVRVGKHAAGRLLDGREWNEFPRVGGEG